MTASNSAISDLVDFMNVAATAYYAARFPALPVEPFSATYGKRYAKVVRDGSVHCFVDLNTLDVLKAAGWNAPAKGARYNLNDPASLEKLKERFDPFGGYLYK